MKTVTPRELCDDRGRDWSKATVSQKAPKHQGSVATTRVQKEARKDSVQKFKGSMVLLTP